jgi:hypothetical protein
VRKTHLMVLALVAIGVVLAAGAVAAYAAIDSGDTQKPVTTSNVSPAPYWDTAGITLTATDDAGIRYIYYKFDYHPVRLDIVDGSPKSTEANLPMFKDTALSPDVLAPGKHTLKFWAQDVNGNVEAANTVSYTIVKDTVGPTTSATVASVRKGRTATLKYMVADPEPTKGTATVKIVVKNARKKPVKTINVASVAVNTARTARFRCRLATGTYRYYVYATDASGNAQTKVGSAKLTVK